MAFQSLCGFILFAMYAEAGTSREEIFDRAARVRTSLGKERNSDGHGGGGRAVPRVKNASNASCHSE
jgi:hypothetical protein